MAVMSREILADFLSGLYATFSINNRRGDRHYSWHSRVQSKKGDIGTGHNNVTVSEVYKLYDPVDHIVSEGDEGIYAPDVDTVYEVVDEVQNGHRPDSVFKAVPDGSGTACG